MLKTNIEWIKKNVPGDLKIWKEMISEIDWKDVKKKQLNKMRMDKERIQSEVRDFIALSPAEKWDRFINGERQLGRLYQKGAIAFTRREWKGVESTARDFQNWLILWADMLKICLLYTSRSPSTPPPTPPSSTTATSASSATWTRPATSS